jgi:amino acid adenylation domain-containing protein
MQIIHLDPPRGIGTLVDVLRLRAQQPNREAYTFLLDGETSSLSLSYTELDERARAIGALLGQQAAPGSRALLLYPPGLEYIAAFFGCLYAGIVAIPAYPPQMNWRTSRLPAIVADAQATLALTTRQMLASMDRWLAQAPELQQLQWLATDEEGVAAAPHWSPPEVSGDTLAFLQYTSGSTSAPKGVMLTHDNLLHNQRLICEGFGHTSDSRGVIWLPPYHDMGLIGGILQGLYAGFPITLMSPVAFLQRPLRWLEAISRYRATSSGGPNFAYDLCARKVTPDQCAGLDLSSWDVAFSGAEPVRPDTLERFATAFAPYGFRREAFYPCYGLAEATLIVSGGSKTAPPIVRTFDAERLTQHCAVEVDATHPEGRALVGCGHMLGDQRVRIVEPERQTYCGPDEIGEIWVSGPSVAQGYWCRAEATTQTFRAYITGTDDGPYLRTGDLGFVKDGELFITGRLKDLVIIRGRNHYPQDIELTVEQSHPALRPSAGAAFAVEIEGEERLVVVQEVERQHRKTDLGAVIAAIRRAVAEHHEIPVYGVVLIKPGSIPKTSSGKIQRHACRGGFLDDTLAVLTKSVLDATNTVDAGDSLPVGPRTHVEEQVAAIWADVLGVDRVGVQDHFFELGGDSLLATQLIARLNDRFGIDLPLRALFEAPTVAGLAATIDRAERAHAQIGPSPLRATYADALPLSFAQQQMWLLDQIEPGNAAYTIPLAVRLQGVLDVAALEAAFHMVVERHETLRTTFELLQGQPRQRIAPTLAVDLPLHDLASLAAVEREQAATRLTAEVARQPFDLARGPLLRLALLRLAEQSYVLVVVLHHSIADGWSVGVLSRDLAGAYAAAVAGQDVAWSPLPIQYADYALWQRSWLEGDAGARLRAYWQQQLAGAPTILDLPTDQPRPAIQTFDGASETLLLPGDLTSAINGLSQQMGATVFMTLLAAFATVLGRASRQEDLLIAAPIANRGHSTTQDLIGCFVNTLVLRLILDDDPSFRTLLGRAREVCLGAYAHQDLPFEQVVELIQPERDPSRSPLVQVMLNMHNFEQTGLALPGIAAEVLTLPEPDAKFDLSLYASDASGRLRLDLVYNRNLFDQGRMQALLEQIGYLLQQAVARPDERSSSLSLVTPSMATVLPDPCQPLKIDWQGAVHEWFAQQAARTPARIALRDREASWSYAALHAASNRLAHRLRDGGIGAQDVVAIYGQRSAAMVWAMLAVLKAGAAFVILDPTYPAARLVATLRAATPRGWLQLESAGEVPEPLAAFIDAQADMLRVIVPRRETSEAAFADYSDADLAIVVAPDDLAYVAFTSGSTGTPKGILGSHRPLTHFLRWYRDTFRLTADDRFSMLSGLAHDPLLRDVFTPLCLGATLCIPAPDDLHHPARLLGWLRDEAITVAHITPALAQMLSDEAETTAAPIDLPAPRYLCFGGDMLTWRDVARVQRWASDATCINLYGATETPQAMGYFVLPRETAAAETQAARVPVGQGISDVQLLILNVAGQVAGIGEIGEIVVRTPYLSLGYLDDGELTRQRFSVNPWTGVGADRLYRTGDLGRYLADGSVQCLGRADQQIKLRGFRIEPGEIEIALGQHPAVQTAVVLLREAAAAGSQPGDRRLVAYIIPKQSPEAVTRSQEGESTAARSSVSAQELRRFLHTRLPDYMVPSAFVFLETLPLTPNGKLDRRALPAPAPSEHTAEGVSTARTPTEELVAGIWRDVLALDRVGMEENFFALGGHSLLATQLLSRVRTLFHVELPLRALFERPTIAGLSETIDRARRDETVRALPDLLPVDRSQYRMAQTGPESEIYLFPTSFAQQRMWLLDQIEPGNVAYTIPLALRLQGPLDVSALRAAFQALVTRHETLRTSFALVHGQPMQRIGPTLAVDLPLHDLQSVPSSDQEAAVARLTAEVLGQPFDLARGPLLRLALLRLAEQAHVLVLALHHSIADGWSMGVLSRDLASAYAATVAGVALRWSPIRVQYADYALWQRSWLEGESGARLRAYWQQQLADAPTILDLPTDRPRPAELSYRGKRYAFAFSQDLTAAVNGLSQQTGVTAFMTLLAAFATVLGRASRQEELLIGAPIANRTHAEIERLIGFFANTLVLRMMLDGDPSFCQLLARVREVCLGAYAHQDLPFEQVVELIQPERDLRYTPLIQVLFVLQNAPLPPLELPGVAVDLLEADAQAAKFDLTLSMLETEGVFSGTLEYNCDLFDETTIVDLLARFQEVLVRASADPQISLSAVYAHIPAQKLQLVLAATFTADPIADALAFWMEQFNVPLRLDFAAYSQVFQQLLDPASGFSANREGINLILLRLEDWAQTCHGPQEFGRRLAQNGADFVAAVRSFAATRTQPCLIGLCPPSDVVRADRERLKHVMQAEQALTVALAPLASVCVLDLTNIGVEYDIGQVNDAQTDTLGHIPYTDAGFAALGTAMARAIVRLGCPAPDVIVVDCDQTLWAGVVGEDEPEHVSVTPPYGLLQEQILRQVRYGTRLCLCSKNNEADVFAAFRSHPEQPLRLSHLTSWRINWEPTGDNVRALANELRVPLDRMMYISQSPVECAAMRAVLPQVLTLQLPPDPDDIPAFLRHIWLFQLDETVPHEDRTTLWGGWPEEVSQSIMLAPMTETR